MPRTVHHYFPYGSTNVGDALVAHAIQRALVKHFGPLEFINIPVNDRCKDAQGEVGLRSANLRRTNAQADLVVIGGSNLLEPRKPVRPNHPKAHLHWGVVTDMDDLHQLRVPLLLLGMGTGSDWGQTIRPYTAQAAQEIKLLHRKAFAAAVRDEPTQKKLSEIGVAARCTGCPVTFLTDRPIRANRASGPLLVSLPPARLLKYWSGRWFMRQTMSYLKWLKRQKVNFLVTLHERPDLEFAPNWVPKGIPRFYTESIQELVDRYEDSCGVIGFRLHAALLGLGLGKPIVPVNVDWRGRAFSQTFALDDLALEQGHWGQFSLLRKLTLHLLSAVE